VPLLRQWSELRGGAPHPTKEFESASQNRLTCHRLEAETIGCKYMIERITIENFKSFKRVDLKLGSLNLFIGTNASGKSNFFDALRVLQGICNGFTISEILDGKPPSPTGEKWDGIRGGSAQACFSNEYNDGQVTISVSGKTDQRLWDFSISFSPLEGMFTHECIKIDNFPIYDSDIGLQRSIIILGNLRNEIRRKNSNEYKGNISDLLADNNSEIEIDQNIIKRALLSLSNSQHLDPHPSVLRQYAQSQHIQRMGERGENFAALVKAICQEVSTKEAYLGWLKQLRPAEVDDVGVLSGAVGEPMFMLKEGERSFAAPVLSDGTLRFAAITAAFFQPDMPSMILIEEIENGIHAGRLRLLIELLRGQSGHGDTQVIATTHSPMVLAWLQPHEYNTTFFCKRDEETGESVIRPVSDIPHFQEVLKKQSIADLFAEGWLEAAL
jgi:predicted ATPase